MPYFRYKAMDRKGQVVEGSSDAEDLNDLVQLLKSEDLFLVEGKPAKEPQPVQEPQSQEAAAQPPKVIATSRDTVPMAVVAAFTNELAIMVRTALPIVEALESLASQQSNPVFKYVLQDVARSVREGQSMSHAFSRYPKIFEEVYISLLNAGEAGGRMPEMLDRIEAHLNFQLELRAKVKGAMLYPVIVVAVSLAVVGFLVIFILPTFMDVFSQLGVELPLPTRILLNISDYTRRFWPVLVVAAIGAGMFFRWWLTFPANRKLFDSVTLRTPIVGPVVQAIVLTRSLRTLASLLTSGVPILQSIELARAASGNAVYADLYNEVFKSARDGHGIHPALARSPHFPKAVTNMIANAEKTGTLPAVLNEVADYHEKVTEMTLKNLFSAIEPIFVVFLGLMVGGIAVSILLPIFEVGGAIG